MSDTRKKVARPAKSKVAQKSAPTSSAPPTSAVSAIDEIVAPVVLNPKPAQDAPKRVQVGKAIGLNIAVARTRRHIDKLNMNSGPDAYINALKAQLAPYKQAQKRLESGKIVHLVEKEYQYVKDGKTLTGKKIFEELRDLTDAERAAEQTIVDKLAPSVPAWEAKLTAFARERVRFSSESAVVLAVICDEVIIQLATHTMDCALAAGKKIIQISHLYEEGVSKLPLYPLVEGLPLFKTTSKALNAKLAEEASAKALHTALTQAEKDFKKKYNVHAKRKQPAAEGEPAPANGVVTPVAEPEAEPAVAEEDETEEHDCPSFKMYVSHACKEVASKAPQYKSIRVSTDIRNHFSDILIELIQRLSAFIAIGNAGANSKTVTYQSVMHAVEAILVDGHKKVETIKLEDTKIQDPAALKAEVAKRDDAKAKGEKYKINMEAIPKIDGYVVHRAITYPTSGYPAIAAVVDAKLAAFNALPKKEKAEIAGEPDALEELIA